MITGISQLPILTPSRLRGDFLADMGPLSHIARQVIMPPVRSCRAARLLARKTLSRCICWVYYFSSSFSMLFLAIVAGEWHSATFLYPCLYPRIARGD